IRGAVGVNASGKHHELRVFGRSLVDLPSAPNDLMSAVFAVLQTADGLEASLSEVDQF
ncbi:MAG: hypothetical protein F6K04_19400, partial [Leptolyngbya sp. SIO4C5]|nr:hypothetical protein [Leptolyngbya sp. SIO4C5]